jgi:hypothetical protein
MARAGSRKPKRRERADWDTPRSYRVIAISLYEDQARSVDRTLQKLAEAGYPKASRSLVIQAAIQRLEEEVQGKLGSDLIRYFLEHQLKRPLSSARARSARALPRRSPLRSQAGGKG